MMQWHTWTSGGHLKVWHIWSSCKTATISKLKVGSLRMCSMFTRLASQVYKVTQASTTHSVFPSSVLLYTVGKPKQHCPILPLSHDSRTTTNFHNSLYVLYRWYWIPQSHTWQPLSMCRQNSVMDWPPGKNRLSWLSDRALAAQPEVSGFDSRRLPAFYTFLYFCLITSISSLRQDALRVYTVCC